VVAATRHARNLAGSLRCASVQERAPRGKTQEPYDPDVSNRRHDAFVKDPHELRMGSPQYGELILDGQTFQTKPSLEWESLLWSDDERLLAGQELVAWENGPQTRVVVIAVDIRELLAASEAHKGLCNPVQFEPDGLIYRHWHHQDGETELRLDLPPPEVLDVL